MITPSVKMWNNGVIIIIHNGKSTLKSLNKNKILQKLF